MTVRGHEWLRCFGIGISCAALLVAGGNVDRLRAQSGTLVWTTPNVPVRVETRPVDGSQHPKSVIQFKPDYHYAHVAFTVAPGTAYTLEYRAVQPKGYFGVSIFDGNPLAPDSDARALTGSTTQSRNSRTDRPPLPQKWQVAIDPKSKGRTLFVQLAYGADAGEPVKDVTFEVVLIDPARPYVTVEVVPGWESEGLMGISDTVNRGEPVVLQSVAAARPASVPPPPAQPTPLPTPPQPPSRPVAGETVLLDRVVPASGGRVEYRKPGDPLDGLTIDVPAGAYDGARSFRVSSRPAPAGFATPLIAVENGGDYSATPMTIRIPASIRDDEFAMAFFYDERTGRREGLPLVQQDQNGVTSFTRHFSLIGVLKMLKSGLPNEVASGYLPGVDDWHMPNNGSVVAPGGHCAGQALSSMWYYYEKKLNGGPKLSGRYDNNVPGFQGHPTSPTPGFWQDDSLALRLVSTIQKDGYWSSTAYAEWWKLMRRVTDTQVFDQFRLAMTVTGEPQYVELWDNWDHPKYGHVMVVYRVADSRLYVADPNYPAGLDPQGNKVPRYIEFDKARGTLLPFRASTRANGPSIVFVSPAYGAKSAVVSWPALARRWEEFTRSFAALPSQNARLIGSDRFPDYALKLSTKNFEPGSVQDIVDETTVNGTSIAVRVDCESYKWPVTPPRPTCATAPMRVIVYQDRQRLQLAPAETIALKSGKNTLGFLVESALDPGCSRADPDCWSWVDYKEYNVWAGQSPSTSAPQPPPTSPPTAGPNPCAGLTVAEIRKGLLKTKQCSLHCAAISGPTPTDAQLQACIDGRARH